MVQLSNIGAYVEKYGCQVGTKGGFRGLWSLSWGFLLLHHGVQLQPDWVILVQTIKSENLIFSLGENKYGYYSLTSSAGTTAWTWHAVAEESRQRVLKDHVLLILIIWSPFMDVKWIPSYEPERKEWNKTTENGFHQVQLVKWSFIQACGKEHFGQSDFSISLSVLCGLSQWCHKRCSADWKATCSACSLHVLQ